MSDFCLVIFGCFSLACGTGSVLAITFFLIVTGPDEALRSQARHEFHPEATAIHLRTGVYKKC